MAWFEDMKHHILTSPDGDGKPWVLLNDCREMLGAALDAWEPINEITEWEQQHNCLLIAVVISTQLQQFMVNAELGEQLIVQTFLDYEKAHLSCLEKLRLSSQ
ncbi:hypothetical protein L4C34_04320 [Vibrio profundum]|uniref:hypothetical protein n=1 Tax=Vibrio profundum TaxID=2910247 RepID=UPI003D1119B2